MGDATVGEGANIGAGVVTCNYDGVRKHPTEIGPGAFIGSDTMLVAPVKVGDGATTAAGSVSPRTSPTGRWRSAGCGRRTSKARLAGLRRGRKTEREGAEPMCGIVGYVGSARSCPC